MSGLRNTPNESFFATLKPELVHHELYLTRDEAQRHIFKYIEVFCNRKHLHAALNYRSSVEIGQEYLLTTLCPF